MSRRGALVLLGGLGLAVAGCSGGSDSSSATATTKGSSSTTSTTSGATTTTTNAATVSTCSNIPEETGGPYPGDGTNGQNVLTERGVVRRDIRSSFDGYSGTAEGVPLTLQFTVVDTDDGCKPLTGGAVYVWHADRDGMMENPWLIAVGSSAGRSLKRCSPRCPSSSFRIYSNG